MRITLLPLVLFALAAGPAFARAQTPGEDNCNSISGPTPISGLGSFFFDNSNASTGNEGQNESLCYQFGSSSIENDVWFSWTAPTTSTFIVDTCTTTSVDTKIAAYADNGVGCPTTASLACNDDTCGLQSEITFQGTQNSSYMLQIGTFPGASGGFGTFNISSSGPSNDDCNSPAEIPSGPGTFPYDCTSATTGNEGQGEILCYAFGTSLIKEDVWFVWTASFTGMAEITTCGLTDDDTKIAVYPVGAAGACPQAGSAIACNDDACGLQSRIAFAAVGGAMYSIQIGRSPLAGGGRFSTRELQDPADSTVLGTKLRGRLLRGLQGSAPRSAGRPWQSDLGVRSVHTGRRRPAAGGCEWSADHPQRRSVGLDTPVRQSGTWVPM